MTPTIVVKLGGAVVEDGPTLDALAAEVAELRRKGRAVVLVHGGGVQLDRALRALGEDVVKHQGLRVTSPAAARTVQAELDRVGARLAEALAARGVAARHVPSTEGRLHATVKRLQDGFDLGRVGTAERFVVADLPRAPDGPAPVVTPVGVDDEGPLNVNADEGAACVAAAFEAELLLLATDVEHVRDEHGEAIEAMDAAAAHAFLASEAAQGGMVPKVQAALGALEGGARAVLVTRLAPGRLVAAVDGTAPGTRITNEASP